jgi:hypothetical protein
MWLGLMAAFGVSAAAHCLLALMALGEWQAALLCGSFFLVQPAFIAVERGLRVRRWNRVAAHAWTLGALAASSPLVIEPALQIVGIDWFPTGYVVPPTAATLAAAIGLSGFVTIASLPCARVAPKHGELG